MVALLEVIILTIINNLETMNSQNKQILSYLQQGNSITPLEALNHFNCFRLGARIFQLKKLGHPIETEMVYNNGKHFASYHLKHD